MGPAELFAVTLPAARSIWMGPPAVLAITADPARVDLDAAARCRHFQNPVHFLHHDIAAAAGKERLAVNQRGADAAAAGGAVHRAIHRPEQIPPPPVATSTLPPMRSQRTPPPPVSARMVPGRSATSTPPPAVETVTSLTVRGTCKCKLGGAFRTRRGKSQHVAAARMPRCASPAKRRRACASLAARTRSFTV